MTNAVLKRLKYFVMTLVQNIKKVKSKIKKVKLELKRGKVKSVDGKRGFCYLQFGFHKKYDDFDW